MSAGQYEFQQCLSVGDPQALVSHSWSVALGNHEDTYLVLLDMSKAFKLVWDEDLLVTLSDVQIHSSSCVVDIKFPQKVDHLHQSR